MTPCIAGPEKPIKDANHKRPAVHYAMAPGTAWRLNTNGRVEVKITPEMAKRAEYTFCLYQGGPGGLAEFRIGAVLYAQPTEAIIEPKKRTRAVDVPVKPQPTPPSSNQRGAAIRPAVGGGKRRRAISLDW